jgi:hypothetical protein
MDQKTPCWHCASYAGMTGSGEQALCAQASALRVCARPEQGCGGWSREPGVDDFVPVEWLRQRGSASARRSSGAVFRGTTRPRMPPAPALRRIGRPEHLRR